MQILSSVQRGVGYREIDLVMQAARTFLSNGGDGGLKAALTQPLDWPAIERRADRHSMMPPIAYALTQYGENLVPLEVRERLQQRLLFTAKSNLKWLQEWCRILATFEAAGVPVISFKGPALALLAYPNLALREFGDLDLLVRPADVFRARNVLAGEGYELRFSSGGDTDAALLRSGNQQTDLVNGRGMLIDLHWGLLHEMFSFQLPVDELFESAQAEYREGLSFLSLSPEHLLLYLCAHGTKHCWLNLRELLDVVCHLQTAQKLDWGLCMRLAESVNCELVLKHSLLLAEQVLGLELPAAIKNDCDDAKALMLARRAASLLFQEDGDLGYGKALRYHLTFAKGWRDRAHLIFERVFVPAEVDWQKVRLPRSLHFLYYAVRPVRFIFERFSRPGI